MTGLGKKWNDATLDKYLKSPADYAPGKCPRPSLNFMLILFANSLDSLGNAMAFAGIPNAKDRGDVIAYLKANS